MKYVLLALILVTEMALADVSCIFSSLNNSGVHGEVTFLTENTAIRIQGNLYGLTPGEHSWGSTTTTYEPLLADMTGHAVIDALTKKLPQEGIVLTIYETTSKPVASGKVKSQQPLTTYDG